MKRRKQAAARKAFNVDMAGQRIERLFGLAERACRDRPDLADRYVDIARRISMRHRVSIPGGLKRHVCKECGGYMAPGVNARVRIDGRNVLITCLRCGGIKRYPYKSESREPTGQPAP
ncbi:MAG: Ribonuclease P protein component 4 [Methanocella sp. PtaU1.Bin125]|nr:MAG: Ribonuclease P protein component 4 [Methanocella sp. PtaU1.Bin125]